MKVFLYRVCESSLFFLTKLRKWVWCEILWEIFVSLWIMLSIIRYRGGREMWKKCVTVFTLYIYSKVFNKFQYQYICRHFHWVVPLVPVVFYGRSVRWVVRCTCMLRRWPYVLVTKILSISTKQPHLPSCFKVYIILSNICFLKLCISYHGSVLWPKSLISNFCFAYQKFPPVDFSNMYFLCNVYSHPFSIIKNFIFYF